MTYREFVERKSQHPWPSDTILNQNSEHAAVIVEFLFLRSSRTVHFVTEKFANTVYGAPAVIAAARRFLTENPTATIEILSENNVVRGDHPFFVQLDTDFAERIVLRFIPPTVWRTYRFNFAIADGQSYRFEENRQVHEAFVRLGDQEYGTRLEGRFVQLSRVAVSQLAA